LDEIGELSPDLQAKLLRLLQEREVRPIGATKPVKVNVRVIAATNRDLAKAVALGQFRQDLYYRLNVIKIRVPALRERKQDIPALIHHFSKIYATEGLTISEQAFRRLVRHEWPGNVRQLENTIRRMVVLRSNPIITTDDLPSTVRFDDPE
jgi:transcriptional regulator with PAS, ATPase and Fis domain